MLHRLDAGSSNVSKKRIKLMSVFMGRSSRFPDGGWIKAGTAIQPSIRAQAVGQARVAFLARVLAVQQGIALAHGAVEQS